MTGNKWPLLKMRERNKEWSVELMSHYCVCVACEAVKILPACNDVTFIEWYDKYIISW